MKILAFCSNIDLKFRLGIVPAWWQLFETLCKMGHEIIITPYLGDAVESLYWSTYPNPCLRESLLYYSLASHKVRSMGGKGMFSQLSMAVIKSYIRPRWERHLLSILDREGDIDAVLFTNVPMNHVTGIPSKLKSHSRLPVLYYDGDLPTSLPGFAESGAFKFNQYPGADIGEYDAFLSSSKGAIPALEQMGAKNVHAFYYWVDPELYSPMEIEKSIDIFYYGHTPNTKEKRIGYMIAEPSRTMADCKFLVGGNPPKYLDIGKAKTMGRLPISKWKVYCCRSKINLNITKEIDANTYATSSMRPFELASLGCCVVTDSYKGLEEWFEVDNEMFMVYRRKSS